MLIEQGRNVGTGKTSDFSVIIIMRGISNGSKVPEL